MHFYIDLSLSLHPLSSVFILPAHDIVHTLLMHFAVSRLTSSVTIFFIVGSRSYGKRPSQDFNLDNVTPGDSGKFQLPNQFVSRPISLYKCLDPFFMYLINTFLLLFSDSLPSNKPSDSLVSKKIRIVDTSPEPGKILYLLQIFKPRTPYAYPFEI